MKVKIKKPKSFKVLRISTGHITEADGKKISLKEVHVNWPTIYTYEFGAFVGCEDKNRYSDFSNSFNDILKFARKKGYTYVNFDADAPVYKKLKLYDW